MLVIICLQIMCEINESKRVAIMQPYLFPYIGYFNLLSASDIFVFYDDVNFKKKSWINRNYINYNGNKFLFTLPLEKASQNKKINEINIFDLESFKKSFMKNLYFAYSKTSYYEDTISYIESVFSLDFPSISNMCINSIILFCDYLNLQKTFYKSSILSPDSKNLEKSKRLIHIVNKLNSDTYINNESGSLLYNKDNFQRHNISLEFVRPIFKEYKQSNEKLIFHRGLSIIDLMMNLSKDQILNHLNSYDLI